MILAGDVGGTKVHLALYSFTEGRLQPVRDQKFPAHEFGSLDAVVNKFLDADNGNGEAKRVEEPKGVIILKSLKDAGREVERNSGASVRGGKERHASPQAAGVPPKSER